MFFFFNGFFFFFFNDTATTEIYTLSLHDALPIFLVGAERDDGTLGIELFLEHDDLALDLVAGGLDDVEPLVQDQLLPGLERLGLDRWVEVHLDLPTLREDVDGPVLVGGEVAAVRRGRRA